jgi:hypothetical protein
MQSVVMLSVVVLSVVMLSVVVLSVVMLSVVVLSVVAPKLQLKRVYIMDTGDLNISNLKEKKREKIPKI